VSLLCNHDGVPAEPQLGWRAWKIAVCVMEASSFVVIATLATCCAIHRRERACITIGTQRHR
jgi:hypothetical protein